MTVEHTLLPKHAVVRFEQQPDGLTMIHFAPLLGTLLLALRRWWRLTLYIPPVPGSILLHDIESMAALRPLRFELC